MDDNRAYSDLSLVDLNRALAQTYESLAHADALLKKVSELGERMPEALNLLESPTLMFRHRLLDELQALETAFKGATDPPTQL